MESWFLMTSKPFKKSYTSHCAGIYLPKQINSPPYGESGSDFKRLRMKNPAGYLYKTIRNLTPEQRVVVRKLGLGSLLELKINRLPSRLAFWLVERFDSNTGVLKVFDKEISITPELIRKTLDLPMGYLDVEDTNLWDLATPDPTHKAWKRQYPEGRRVSVANVADMIEKSSGDTGSSFILNFVVLFVSTMSNVSSDGNANASFLPSLVIDHYIMDHLKKGVKNWKEIEEEKKKINQKFFSSVIFANTLLKEPVFPALKFCTSKLLRELDGIMFGIDKFQKKTFKWAPYSDDADDTNYQFVFSAGSDANDEDADADDDNVGSNESVEDADSVEANNFFQREPDIVIDTECDLDTRSPVSASNTLSHGSASNFVASVLKASVETQEPEPDIAINNTECEPAIASVETQEPEPDIAINNTECEPDIASVETQEPEPDIAINNTECEPNIAINKKKGRKGRDGCLDSGFRISKDLPSKRAVTTLGTPEGTTRHGRDVVSPPVVKRSTRQPVAGRVSNDGPIQRPRRDPRKPLKLMDYEDLVVGADEASGRQDSEDDASVVAEFANLSLAGDEIVHDLFNPLTDEEDEMVATGLSNSKGETYVVSHESSNIMITGKTLQCLGPREWLNDEVINIYLDLLKERELREPKKYLKCHFFHTFFYPKLLGGKTSAAGLPIRVLFKKMVLLSCGLSDLMIL
ncbi:ubiquitin-like-specific protease ESD4 [Tanacetum coccineum]